MSFFNSGAMRRIFGQSVYAKCLWITAVTTVVVATLVSVQNFSVSEKIARESIIDLGTTNTVNAARAMGGAIRFQKTEEINRLLAQLLDGSDGRAHAAIVLSLQGNVLSELARPGGDVAQLVQVARATLRDDMPRSGTDGLDIAIPVSFGATDETVGVLAVGWTAAPVLSRLAQEKIRTLIISAVSLSAMLGLSIFLLQRILGHPLRCLEVAVQSVANGDYGVPIAGAGRPDEIGRLARNLDQMRLGLAEAKLVSDRAAEDHVEQQNVIAALTSGLQSLAAGDLTAQISQDFSTRYQQLSVDFNNTVHTLHDAVLTIVQNAEIIRKESDEIGGHSSDLSRRTENQAATLEETAAALDQLTSGVRAAADSAREVEGIVHDAQTQAIESATIVAQTVAAMSQIEGSSTQISTIISVIDDIAFQTNLLALNAGVEAARAGEAGRGFAVVASEVRALAQRSSEAAQEIKTLIGGSSQHVARGVKLVGKTGDALTSITARVTEIASLTSSMANAATEQSRGLAEINIGVSQLDKVTQQNAGMVESADAASQSLRRQAAALGKTVEGFTTNASGRSRGARVAA
ncbi:methyl-accepting chemotaxis protein [Yoonia sp.]|uniref:methyl-accepting chemotaxis protein n=1 Tax=Yoonia sp. TaxID=2212373 RepID=UPI0019E59FCC|nr:methyl-accepting chemotaxis protein [Yoonia sp.]MBE0413467.1 HAMP domain-containing protein [Yoonia sp.]